MGEMSEKTVVGSSECCSLSGTRARAAVLAAEELDVGKWRMQEGMPNGDGEERAGKAELHSQLKGEEWMG